jgi:hypothetical protein
MSSPPRSATSMWEPSLLSSTPKRFHPKQTMASPTVWTMKHKLLKSDTQKSLLSVKEVALRCKCRVCCLPTKSRVSVTSSSTNQLRLSARNTRCRGKSIKCRRSSLPGWEFSLRMWISTRSSSSISSTRLS